MWPNRLAVEAFYDVGQIRKISVLSDDATTQFGPRDFIVTPIRRKPVPSLIFIPQQRVLHISGRGLQRSIGDIQESEAALHLLMIRRLLFDGGKD